MQKHTHLAFAAALGVSAVELAVIHPTHLNLTFAGAGLIIGALLPDIDHVGSTVGRRVPVLSYPVSYLFGHRGLTHSLLFLVILGWIMNLWFSPSFVCGIMVGMVSHLIGDMLTRRGIRLFYPIKIFVRFPITFRTGGPIEQILFVGLSVWSMIKGWELIMRYL